MKLSTNSSPNCLSGISDRNFAMLINQKWCFYFPRKTHYFLFFVLGDWITFPWTNTDWLNSEQSNNIRHTTLKCNNSNFLKFLSTFAILMWSMYECNGVTMTMRNLWEFLIRGCEISLVKFLKSRTFFLRSTKLTVHSRGALLILGCALWESSLSLR